MTLHPWNKTGWFKKKGKKFLENRVTETKNSMKGLEDKTKYPTKQRAKRQNCRNTKDKKTRESI